MSLLLDHHAPVDAPDAYGDSPLMWAASRGHGAVVRRLWEAGADLGLTNHFGSSALHAAAFMHHSAVVWSICALTAAESTADANSTATNEAGAHVQEAACTDALDTPDAHGATPRMLLAATAPVLLSPSEGTTALARLMPPLPTAWTAAASRLASPSERLLLLHRTDPSAVSAGALITEIATLKQSLTFDRRVRTMLQSNETRAVLHAEGLLGPGDCRTLIAAVDADASLRNGTTDGMPEHTMHLQRAELERLIGHVPVESLWALPARYRLQAGLQARVEGAASSPTAIECFIRKFSAQTRPWIRMHADVAAVTVNIALTDEVDESPPGDDSRGGVRSGGGRLLGIYDGAVRAIARRAGDATVHPSSLLHGVSRMDPGVAARYTLIVFFQ